MDWRNKVLLITGASSGIGRGLSLKFAARGAKVGLFARRADMLNEIAAEITRGGGEALALPGDVTDLTAVRAAAERLRSELGPIDVLIANAGTTESKPNITPSPDEVSKVFQINFMGAVNSVAAVVHDMIERGSGHLVAISSLAAYRGLPKSAAYCSSKAALSSFFESLRVDLRAPGVDVTIIHPGFIKTPLTAGRHAKMPFLMELDEALDKIIRAIEMKRSSCAFPWQLASVVRLGLIIPPAMYDRIARRNSFRE